MAKSPAHNAQVETLRSLILAKIHVDVPVPVAQSVIAAIHGVRNWNTLVATATPVPKTAKPGRLQMESQPLERQAESIMALIPDSANAPGAEYYRRQTSHNLRLILACLPTANLPSRPLLVAAALDSLAVTQHLLSAQPTSPPAAARDLQMSANAHSPQTWKAAHGGLSGRLYASCLPLTPDDKDDMAWWESLSPGDWRE